MIANILIATKKAQDLYERMTDYNTLVFTFLWCDLVQELKKIQKRIQSSDLEISDIGRSITLLCTQLKKEYPLKEGSEILESFPWIDGHANYIMQQFCGKDYLAGVLCRGLYWRLGTYPSDVCDQFLDRILLFTK